MEFASTGDCEAQLKELWHFRDAFFAKDPTLKKELLQKRVDSVIGAIDSAGTKATQRARAAFVRGRALDASEEYSQQAEDELSRSLKLAPEDVEAWNALGHVLWKKRELDAAREAFTSALETMPKNAVALRSLSMLARAVASKTSTTENPFDASIRLAKEALGCDLNDAESWYTLGNAQVARFFHTGRNGRAPADVKAASKAYAQAEAKYNGRSLLPAPCDGAWGNPDLYFNRANLRRYLEDYPGACSDLKCAAALDGSLSALEMLEDTKRWIRRVADLVTKKGSLKPKRRTELETMLLNAKLASPPGYRSANVEDLALTPAGAGHFGAESPNAGRCISAVVLLELRRDTAVPPDALIVLVASSSGPPACLALSVYDGATEHLAPGSKLLILDPILVDAHLPDDTQKAYTLIRVTAPSKRLILNGAPLPFFLSGAASATQSAAF